MGSANRQFLYTDHQGSVIAVVDNNGTVQSINTYNAYGVPGSTNQGRFGYTGQMYLKELGLYHYRARVYDPRIGRFMQTDPVGYADQINMYAYVGNDPLNATDPSGMCPWCVGLVFGAGLEIARQAITGELSLSAASLGKIAIAGAAGAVGAGIAEGIAGVTASLAVRAAGNAVAGASIGVVSTVSNNAIDGKSLTGDVGTGAVFGAVAGAAGSALSDTIEGAGKALKDAAFNKLPTAMKNLMGHIDEATRSGGGNTTAKVVGVSDAVSNAVGNSSGAIQAASHCNKQGTQEC